MKKFISIVEVMMISVMTLFIIVCFILSDVVISFNKDNCIELGYNINNLNCKTCDIILKILDHEKIYNDCKLCCTEKIEETYTHAILEVDKRYLPFMKDLSVIVEKANELNLIIKNKYGAATLLMYKDKSDDEPSESIIVSLWRVDMIEEYLKTHLIVPK